MVDLDQSAPVHKVLSITDLGPITKTRLFKCTENFTTRKCKFSEKKI